MQSQTDSYKNNIFRFGANKLGWPALMVLFIFIGGCPQHERSHDHPHGPESGSADESS